MYILKPEVRLVNYSNSKDEETETSTILNLYTGVKKCACRCFVSHNQRYTDCDTDRTTS